MAQTAPARFFLRLEDAPSVGSGPSFQPPMWSSKCAVPTGSNRGKLDNLQLDFVGLLRQGASGPVITDALANLWLLSATFPALLAATNLLSPSPPPSKLAKKDLARWAAENIPFARVETLAAIVAARASHPSQALSLDAALAGFSSFFGVPVAVPPPSQGLSLNDLFLQRMAQEGPTLPPTRLIPPPPPRVPATVPPLASPPAPPAPPPGPPSSSLDLSSLVALLASGQQSAQGLSPPPPPSLAPTEKLLSLLDETLRSGGFLQPAAYSHSRLEAVALLGAQSASSTTTVHLGDGFKMSSRKSIADIPMNLTCWEHFSSGFYFILLRMLGMPDMVGLVSDRLLWFHNLRFVCPVPLARKLAYASAFALKYHAAPNWVELASNDNGLLFRFMGPAEGSVLASTSKGGRGRDQEAPVLQGQPSKKAKRSPSLFPDGKEPPSGEAYSRRFPGRFCMSRVDVGAGPCRKGTSCPFSHECSKCGGDHSLADCKAPRQAQGLRPPAAAGR